MASDRLFGDTLKQMLFGIDKCTIDYYEKNDYDEEQDTRFTDEAINSEDDDWPVSFLQCHTSSGMTL